MTNRIDITRYLMKSENYKSFEKRIDRIREFADLPVRTQNKVCKACPRGPEKKRIGCKPGLGCLYYQDMAGDAIRAIDLNEAAQWTRKRNFVVAAFSLRFNITKNTRIIKGYSFNTMNLIVIDPKLPGRLFLETALRSNGPAQASPGEIENLSRILFHRIPTFAEVKKTVISQVGRFLERRNAQRNAA